MRAYNIELVRHMRRLNTVVSVTSIYTITMRLCRGGHLTAQRVADCSPICVEQTFQKKVGAGSRQGNHWLHWCTSADHAVTALVLTLILGPKRALSASVVVGGIPPLAYFRLSRSQ